MQDKHRGGGGGRRERCSGAVHGLPLGGLLPLRPTLPMPPTPLITDVSEKNNPRLDERCDEEQRTGSLTLALIALKERLNVDSVKDTQTHLCSSLLGLVISQGFLMRTRRSTAAHLGSLKNSETEPQPGARTSLLSEIRNGPDCLPRPSPGD